MILDLIRKGDLKGAINLMVADPKKATTAMILSSQLTRLDKESMMGILDYNQSAMHRNRITVAAIALAGGNVEKVMAPQAYSRQVQNTGSLLKELNNIVYTLRRTDEAAYKVGQKIQADLLEYLGEEGTPGHDVNGTKIAELKSRIQDLKNKKYEASLTSREQNVAKIKEHLSARMPSWEDIESAYNLAKALDLVSNRLDDTVRNKVDNWDAKYSVIETIENALR